MIANTPETPYYAVIFSSTLTDNEEGYAAMAQLMEDLAKKQSGFLGFESARSDLGISISYWKDLESISLWKQHTEHQIAQNKGKAIWYSHYKVRISKVERDYEFLSNH